MPDSIFMVHGMWNGPQYLDTFKGFFEKRGYSCAAPALRFHNPLNGRPPDPRLGTTSVLDYIDDLEQELMKISGEPILMGHSMGGLLVQILAGRGHGKAVVLLAPTAPAGIYISNPFLIWKAFRLGLVFVSKTKPTRPTFKAAARILFNRMPSSMHKSLYDQFCFESGQAAREICMWFLDQNRTTRANSASVTCPILVVAGAEDKINPPSTVGRIHATYPSGATFKVFPDHAHWIIAEPKWEIVAGEIAEWLDQISGKGR